MQMAHSRSIESPELPQPDIRCIEHAGSLMYESHESYTRRLNLGSPETDLLVELIRNEGPQHGLYGAKITGGGAGGTVAVLFSGSENVDAEAALGRVCAAYTAKTGNQPYRFQGSSPGALEFGGRQIMRG
jgi:L-arabinokinase